jgi:hypothetical protein
VPNEKGAEGGLIVDAGLDAFAATCRVRLIPDRRQQKERRYLGWGGRRADDVRAPWMGLQHGTSPDRQRKSAEPIVRDPWAALP